MQMLKTMLILFLVAILGAAAFVWWGVYDVAADDPHTAPVLELLETARERSIAARSAAIEVPDLGDAALLRQGAGNYASMCVACHLAPGASPTELSVGLYPAPPDLSRRGASDPARDFWIVKHGIKASGMPAWGKSMDDRYLWGMVAFIQALPRMTPEAYAQAIAASPGHAHGGGETDVSMQRDDHAGSTTPRSSFEPPDDPMASPGDAAAPHGHDDDHQH